jgi:hypothetical protein
MQDETLLAGEVLFARQVRHPPKTVGVADTGGGGSDKGKGT